MNRTNNESSSTGIMISRRKKKTMKIHNVYYNDQETMISFQTQKNVPLGSRVTKTEHKELLDSGNRQQLNPMKLDGIDWPISTTRKEVKSFLGLGNINKEFIQDNRTLTEPLKELLETDKTFLVKQNEQDDKDMIMLPEDLFPNSLDYRFNDELLKLMM